MQRNLRQHLSSQPNAIVELGSCKKSSRTKAMLPSWAHSPILGELLGRIIIRKFQLQDLCERPTIAISETTEML